MTKAIAVARFASISNGEGIGYTIARRRDETRTEPLNRALYKERNCIERLIGRLKQFRRVATLQADAQSGEDAAEAVSGARVAPGLQSLAPDPVTKRSSSGRIRK